VVDRSRFSLPREYFHALALIAILGRMGRIVRGIYRRNILSPFPISLWIPDF